MTKEETMHKVMRTMEVVGQAFQVGSEAMGEDEFIARVEDTVAALDVESSKRASATSETAMPWGSCAWRAASRTLRPRLQPYQRKLGSQPALGSQTDAF